MQIIILFIIVAIIFEILINYLFPKDANKFTVVDYINMIDREKTRNLKGRINNPFSNL